MSQIMEMKFNVEKEERKALVKEISEILGLDSVYKGAPGFAFVVGDYTIDRYGTITFDEGVWLETQQLLAELISRGYVCEGIIEPVIPSEPASADKAEEQTNSGDDPAPAKDEATATDDVGATSATSTEESAFGSLRSVVDEDDQKLTIEIPLLGFTATALDNLHRLVSGKAELIIKALGTDALPIEKTAETLRFSWFSVVSSHLEVDAYARFVHALCELAKKQKRVMLKEKPIAPNASEKFAFRCFLLRLGFIGKDADIASARKILLSKLSGNGSFKSGDHSNRKSAAVKVVGSDEIVPTGIVADKDEDVSGDESDTNIETPEITPAPHRCQECHLHCYYTDGEMRTKDGELVDTSKRAPDKYTHYCLGAPSGFRKLKHATDWSGGETPPKWCPLAVRDNDANGTDGSSEITTAMLREVAV